MSRLVLLVDPDVDKLGELASKLRARARASAAAWPSRSENASASVWNVDA